ncbi:Flp family type IVb pilin [Bacillus sp. FJAT-18017]|uniref:Flp family type IVb pilin n=1 Tax=Bacillus sp. FJAT-18017 TaxID=1705566 RepID=UPI0009EADEB3|nr:Flp family type IVb pilin [Bacillus sp. FJAT-18017]
MMKKMKALLTEEQGQGMTEYGLVLGVIALGVVAILGLFRTEIEGMFNELLTSIQGR